MGSIGFKIGVGQNPLLGLMGVLLLSALVFAPAVPAPPSGDDYVHIYRSQSGANWLSYFLEADGREYRPWVRVSLAAEWWASGGRAWVSHLSNLLLHLLVTSLVFLLAVEIGLTGRPALLAAALFALHPIHTYNVSAIMGRTDIWCSVFLLGAMLAAFRKRPLLCLGLFLMALFSKETAVVFPILLALLLMIRGQLRSQRRLVAGGLLLLLAYFLFRFGVTPVESPGDLRVYLQSGPAALARNLAYSFGSLVVPTGLYTIRAWLEAVPLLGQSSIMVAIVITAGMVWRSRKGFPLSFWMGMIWTVVTLAPVILLFQRRVLYLPSAGFCIAAAVVLSKTWGTRWGRLMTGAILALLAGEIALSSWEWNRAGNMNKEVLGSLAARISRDDPQRSYLILNVPHGLGEAHLFTHDSLASALALELERPIDIRVITRIQRSSAGSPVEVTQNSAGITTRIQPGPLDYFVFDNPELLSAGGRRLPIGTVFRQGPLLTEVLETSDGGLVSAIQVNWASLPENQTLLVLPEEE